MGAGFNMARKNWVDGVSRVAERDSIQSEASRNLVVFASNRDVRIQSRRRFGDDVKGSKDLSALGKGI